MGHSSACVSLEEDGREGGAEGIESKEGVEELEREELVFEEAMTRVGEEVVETDAEEPCEIEESTEEEDT